MLTAAEIFEWDGGEPSPVPPLLVVRELVKEFRYPRGFWRRRHLLRAIDGVSLAVAPNELLAIVGETGSGKSALARMLAAIDVPDAGTISLDGRTVGSDAAARSVLRTATQLITADCRLPPHDPLRTAGDSLVETLTRRGLPRDEALFRASQLLSRVGLEAESTARSLPAELAEPARVLVAIAHALAHAPRLLILDDVLSGLTEPAAASIAGLLLGLKQELGIACLMLSPDATLTRLVASRTLFLSRGRIVEGGGRRSAPGRPGETPTAQGA